MATRRHSLTHHERFIQNYQQQLQSQANRDPNKLYYHAAVDTPATQLRREQSAALTNQSSRITSPGTDSLLLPGSVNQNLHSEPMRKRTKVSNWIKKIKDHK